MACDFFTVVTATFKVLYVFVVIEHATRRILHVNVTRNPTGDWTLQQLREAIPEDHGYRFLIRDRDAEFSKRLDESVGRLRLQVLKRQFGRRRRMVSASGQLARSGANARTF